MRTKLNVNIDHVATLRQARQGSFPDPIDTIKIIKKAKASGIVMHLREDRRHIQLNDLKKYTWQKPHLSNQTGTDNAYHPKKNNNEIFKKYKTWKD